MTNLILPESIQFLYSQTEITGEWLDFRLGLFELGFGNESKSVEVNLTSNPTPGLYH